MLDLKRNKFKWLEEKIGNFFSVFPFTPNQYTLASIFFVLISFFFLINQNFILTIVFFIISGFLDLIDGAVARTKNLSSKVGAYLDTICDRYVEGIILLGMLFLPLPKILLPSYAWIFLILFGSIITTYAKAAAKEKELVNQELKGGLLSRGERIILLLIAILCGAIDGTLVWMTWVLIIIAILSNVTAIQRICLAIKLNLK